MVTGQKGGLAYAGHIVYYHMVSGYTQLVQVSIIWRDFDKIGGGGPYE